MLRENVLVKVQHPIKHGLQLRCGRTYLAWSHVGQVGPMQHEVTGLRHLLCFSVRGACGRSRVILNKYRSQAWFHPVIEPKCTEGVLCSNAILRRLRSWRLGICREAAIQTCACAAKPSPSAGICAFGTLTSARLKPWPQASKHTM